MVETIPLEKMLEKLLESIQKNTSRSQRATIKKAYHLAADAHKFQKRLSGEPYIIHPLQVALILSQYHDDYESICAALLHDVLEDTNISKEYMVQEFGASVTRLVDGVTKISQLKSQSAVSQQVNNIRKMILATVQDPRVILIKLADKLHNMKTLQYQSETKARKISQEVLDIYAPLAGRLGIFKIKWELEDLALYHLDREVYSEIKEKIAEKRHTREDRIKITSSILQQHLKENKVKAEVKGRSKHFFSIYRKMKDSGKSFEEIYDLTGVRILVKDKQDCYATIGIIHSLWNPLPGRFKDYIAVPKSNGYQSLHTTVIGHDGKPLEVQVRTTAMHFVAEYGIAAHWAYKEKEDPGQKLGVLAHLAPLEEDGTDDASFIEELKGSLTDDEVYVFSPKGDIISLPRGATVLDFAFRIHTELGLKCAGGKINDRLVSIRTQVKSGDQLHIVTNPAIRPSLNWLKFLKTSHARAKLRAWFRKQDNYYLPEKTTTDDEPKSPPKEKKTEKSRIHPRLLQTKGNIHPTVIWDGESNMETKFAKCCAPLPGDGIKGFITKGQGISVQKSECPSLRSLEENEETAARVISLHWSGFYASFTVHIIVTGRDRPQLFLDMVQSISHSGANILEAKASTNPDGKVQNSFSVEVDSLEHLENILDSLKKIPAVESAVRQVSPRKKNEQRFLHSI